MTDTNPAVAHVLQYFDRLHLPAPLAEVSGLCADLAEEMVDTLPSSPELTVGLRKLLEAKDAFVRAALPLLDES